MRVRSPPGAGAQVMMRRSSKRPKYNQTPAGVMDVIREFWIRNVNIYEINSHTKKKFEAGIKL